MKSGELEEMIEADLEQRDLNYKVDYERQGDEFHFEFCHEEVDEDGEWKWRVGARYVHYGEPVEVIKRKIAKKCKSIEDQTVNMRRREDFPSVEFVNWLEEQGNYNIPLEKVEEEYPEFFEVYDLGPVTMTYDGGVEEGNLMVPIQDFIDCVKYGSPLD